MFTIIKLKAVRIWVLQIFILLGFLTSCNKEDNTIIPPKDIWDIDKDGIPKFVNTNYIELAGTYRISKFRSSVGHDYSDSFEQCRSMKHYFEPRSDVDWTAIKIYSPVKGIVTRVEQEWTGTKLEIASDDYPAFRFSIFHINLSAPFAVNDKISEGEILGTHIGSQTYSDISVIVNDPTKQGRMVSYFDVMTDSLFIDYSNRGVYSRADVIIPKEVRDANPLNCNGDTFTTTDTLENWIYLN